MNHLLEDRFHFLILCGEKRIFPHNVFGSFGRDHAYDGAGVDFRHMASGKDVPDQISQGNDTGQAVLIVQHIDQAAVLESDRGIDYFLNTRFLVDNRWPSGLEERK